MLLGIGIRVHVACEPPVNVRASVPFREQPRPLRTSALVNPPSFLHLSLRKPLLTMAASPGPTLAADDTASPKRVHVSNPVGERLVGVLDDTGSQDVVVLCHGFRSSKESSTLSNLAAIFVGAGLSSFRFDFSGNGESEGEFRYGNYWKEVEDLRSIINYLTGQGQRVKAIVGHSKGGNVVLLYASKYKDVDIVVNLSGRFGLERGVKERLGEKCLQIIEDQGYVEVKDRNGNIEYRVTKEGLKERLSTDMKSAVRAIPKNCRVLTVHGSSDEVVSVEEAKEFDTSIPNHTLRILNGANHGFSQHRGKLASTVVDFMEGKLDVERS